MLLNNFDQVREWITDNGFKRWVLYKDYTRSEKIIDSAAFPVSDQADKIAMTEKYLRLAGGKAYAAGSSTGSQNDLTVTTEIRLDEMQSPVSGTQQNIEPLNIGEIENRIRKQLKAEIEIENLKKREADVERRERALEAEKQSAMGALVHYFAPLGEMFLKNKMMRNVAGVDADAPVHARKIQPIIPEDEPETKEPETQEEEIFTDAESEELFDLMSRFKAVEPENWLKMLRTVVEMAESGDATYNMAKGFLIK